MFNKNVKKIILFSLSIFVYVFSFGQVIEDKILQSYKDFIEVPKEIVYTHLNKSTFIKNEMLGFTSYVVDKAKKTPSELTANLYCTITDESNKVIKSKLVRVQNGLAHNIFEIDSLFTSGNYSFRAYTNWMLNFKERNYYEHSFQVIDPEIQQQIKQQVNNRNFTIQILPEGGHLVAQTKNNLGIVVKDQNGFGLANAKGKIISEQNDVLTEFQLNQFGITKIPIIPSYTGNYRVVVDHNGKDISKSIDGIKNLGINIILSDLKDKVVLTFRTNPKTAQILKSKIYTLVIHNGSQLKVTSFKFDGESQVSEIIDYKTLFSGINIFTVFDNERNIPVLERIFFNPEGISKANIVSKVRKQTDSITIELKIKQNIDLSKVQNLSVSVLPKQTKSYSFNSSILSQLYLEPYVKGFIENAAYYFSENSTEIRQNLDNLLLTQGWSSYDWGTIFEKNDYKYVFENGIDLLAKINDKKKEEYLVYPLKNNNSKIFNIEENESSFLQKGLFPEEGELYKVALLKQNKKTQKPKLTLNFYPATIPNLIIDSYKIPNKNLFLKTYQDEGVVVPIKGKSTSISETQYLDEVVVQTNKKEDLRIKEIRKRSRGSVDFFDDSKTRGGYTLTSYLTGKGFDARIDVITGLFEITNPNPNTFNNDIPLIILDGITIKAAEDRTTGKFLFPNFISNLRMDEVDYIEVNKSGIGYGIRGGAGVIKIVTDPIKRIRERDNKIVTNFVGEYQFPLTFNAPKKYYTPVYENYTTPFFQQLGVIDWKPNLKADEKGIIKFKILNTYTESINLYIEGIVNNNIFVSEVKTISP